jgi:hypothetical protein
VYAHPVIYLMRVAQVDRSLSNQEFAGFRLETAEE